MKKKSKNRIVKINVKGDQWKIQQLFGELAVRLDRLPDADEVKRNPLRSAPAGLTEMIF
ncbi:3'-5' exonuclease family protein [Mucilaginibacter segetis]|uniref:Uncharacterized protein n=1 Tax=Mucilaginibacter segetis TaxID=2793071 RepID=A0A934UMZ0_9SPHI|nr:hypothetical protein [Mucilaginibacter segetis]MBK0379371.1 hypothetical protein [Mucilaginibacter segetis]